MDFLAQQEAARKKSAWLTVAAVAFLLPVMAITGWILSWAIRFAWLALNDHLAPAAESATVAYPIAALIVILSALVAYSRISSGKALMRRVGARAARRVFILNFFSFQTGKSAKTHIYNCLCLHICQCKSFN